MKKLTKGIVLLLAFVLMFIFSCKKDNDIVPEEDTIPIDSLATDTIGEASAEEAALLIDYFSEKLQFEVDLFNTNAGVEALLTLGDLESPFIGAINVKSVKDFKNIPKAEEADYGTYTYNPNLNSFAGGWEWTDTPTDKLVLLFPVSGSPINNGICTITDFEFTEINTDQIPSSIVFDIIVDNVTQVEFDAKLTWSADGMPTSVLIDLFLNPYAIEAEFNAIDTIASAEVSVKKDTTVIISTFLEAKFNGNLYEDSPASLNGYFQYETLKLQGNLQWAAMEDLLYIYEQPSIEEMNSLFNLELIDLELNNKLGNFTMVEDNYGDPEMAFVFLDGTVADIDNLNTLLDLINDLINPGESAIYYK